MGHYFGNILLSKQLNSCRLNFGELDGILNVWIYFIYLFSINRSFITNKLNFSAYRFHLFPFNASLIQLFPTVFFRDKLYLITGRPLLLLPIHGVHLCLIENCFNVRMTDEHINIYSLGCILGKFP